MLDLLFNKNLIHLLIVLFIIASFLLFVVIPLGYVFFSTHLPKRRISSTPANFGLDYQNISLKMDDNKVLEGWFIPHWSPKGTVLVCHGILANRSRVVSVANMFHQGGYEVYMFDFRGHGDSENSVITYGYKEKDDIKTIIHSLKEQKAKNIGIWGVSMGASIVLQSLPALKDVKFIISDAAFVSTEDITKYRARWIFPEPLSNLLFNIANFYADKIWHISMDKIRPIDYVQNSEIPILFITGDSDRVIPCENSKKLYEAKKGIKEIYIYKGDDHEETYKEPDYKDLILDFAGKYI